MEQPEAEEKGEAEALKRGSGYGGGVVDDEAEKWVHDSSVDHKGNLPLRAATGTWKASFFIIAIEFSERLSYYGLATNLIIYMTKVLNEELKTAAKNVNYWSGVTTIMPLLGGFVADAYLGRFYTAVVSSVIYLGGLGLLALSRLVPRLKPCDWTVCHRSPHIHKVVFFVAIYLISVGTGGHKPSLESFGADQFDDNHAKERKKKMSFFNWWNFGLCAGVLLGVTIIPYMQSHVSWASSYILLTAVMLVSLVVFVAGKSIYRYRKPQGSPLTPMLQVVVAAIAKRHLPLPADAGELYEAPQKHTRLLCHTTRLRFLDKAAIIENKHGDAVFAAEKQNPWRLATVTQVEELKLILSMIPIWLTGLPFGICVAQTTTFFIKQGTIMNRRIANGFEIPPASIYALAAIGMIVSVTLYDKVLVPFLRRTTGGERGISILKRIGIGFALTIAAMASAALVERKRLRKAHDEQTATVSMSVFWLAPQYVILGFGDGFTLVGLQEYFYDQVPDRMRSMGIAFYLSVIGAASFLSSLLITAVDHVTGRGGRKSWFAKDLNKSRLDLFYWLLVVINAVNLCVYVVLARSYSYKNVKKRIGVAESPQHNV